jgi:hypothetical protein
MFMSQFINASSEVVFAASTDIAAWPKHISAIERVELLTDGPVGVGTKFRETRIMFKKEASEEMEITAFDPPNQYVVGSDSCGARFTTTMRFVPHEAGTLLEMEMVTVPTSLMGRLMAPIGLLFKGAMVKMIKRDMADLARAVEQRQDH